MDYKQTLNVTLSDKQPGAMPQRANLPTREPEIQAYWEAIDLYGKSLCRPEPRGTFILHDGPPYSNGNIHLGHSINKIAKDIIVKYKTMQGYNAPYVPGWDNHGMPIENEVSREFRAKGEKPDKVTMRKRCRTYAESFVEKQKGQFKRLGVRGDWDNPYLTMSSDVEARIVEVFGELAEKGFIYRGLKPVLWCGTCETALADAEVEYEPHVSNSIYVRFPVHRDPNDLFGGGTDDPANAYFVIWTTTPWTIPSNLALALHPDADYVVLDTGDAKYMVAEPLAEKVMGIIAPDQAYSLYTRVKGSEVAGMVAWHPLFKRTSLVLTASYVTMEDGTGIVHTAPGHGKEDFETGQKYGLEILCPVDVSGRYTAAAGSAFGQEFKGLRVSTIGNKAGQDSEANTVLIDVLKQSGHLLAHSKYEHSYPHCWRCHSPLIFRATVQWFMDIDHEGHRQKSLEAINGTTWYPPVSINRIGSMVSNRPDWCLSRQRAWGVGIPAFYCKECGKEVLSREAIQSVRDHVAEESSDVWYAKTASELLPPNFACPHCSGKEFDKETDILDVWFDSGSTHYAVLQNSEHWPNLKWPADVYLEGSDQHRGWFNSSLMLSVARTGQAPFRSVITNGFTVDENGRKMSKSSGNGIDPLKVMQTLGADILRLWTASLDYFEDIRCGDAVIEQAGETYRRIRNTFRFFVNNLLRFDEATGRAVLDFDPATDAVPYAEMLDLDRWALAQLDKVVAQCTEGYDAYEFHRVYHAINNFCTVELSAFYVDVLKDRLYCSGRTSPERRSAQTVLYTLAETMARLLAPILSHTAEEVWELLKRPGGVASPQLADFPTARPEAYADVLARWEPVLAVREQVNLAVEAARQEKTIGNPLEAQVEVEADAATLGTLQSLEALLPVVFKVSQVRLQVGSDGLKVRAKAANGVKCARCWLFKEDVGAAAAYPDLCARCAAVVGELAG